MWRGAVGWGQGGWPEVPKGAGPGGVLGDWKELRGESSMEGGAGWHVWVFSSPSALGEVGETSLAEPALWGRAASCHRLSPPARVPQRFGTPSQQGRPRAGPSRLEEPGAGPAPRGGARSSSGRISQRREGTLSTLGRARGFEVRRHRHQRPGEAPRPRAPGWLCCVGVSGRVPHSAR